MTQPRDVDLEEWLNGIGFHPADTEAKQLGHEVARQQIAWLGQLLHQLLPAGRDKSLVFTALEDVLMRANRSLALGGGPNGSAALEHLRRLAVAGPLPQDPRIERYKAEQRERGSGRTSAPEESHPVQDYLDNMRDATLVAHMPDLSSRMQIEIHAEPGQHVQLAVLCKDPEQVAGAIAEADADHPFEGFWYVLQGPEDVNALLASLDTAERHAFGR